MLFLLLVIILRETSAYDGSDFNLTLDYICMKNVWQKNCWCRTLKKQKRRVGWWCCLSRNIVVRVARFLDDLTIIIRRNKASDATLILTLLSDVIEKLPAGLHWEGTIARTAVACRRHRVTIADPIRNRLFLKLPIIISTPSKLSDEPAWRGESAPAVGVVEKFLEVFVPKAFSAASWSFFCWWLHSFVLAKFFWDWVGELSLSVFVLCRI